MKRLGLLAVVLVLGFCGTAEANTVAPPPFQGWIDASRMPSVDETIQVVDAGCQVPGDYATACTAPDEEIIYFSWKDNLGFNPRLAFWHELGHRFDYAVMTDADRRRFVGLTNLPAGFGWRDEYRGTSGVELFADAYALCSRPHGQIIHRRLEDHLTAEGLRAACRMILRLA